MSAWLPEAAEKRTFENCRLVPKSDHSRIFSFACKPGLSVSGVTIGQVLCAARGWLRRECFRSESRTGDPDIAQFGGKIHAHNPQKASAEFWSARRELSHMPQVPFCKSSGTARHHVHRAGQAAVGAHVPDELTGQIAILVLPLRMASRSPDITTIASDMCWPFSRITSPGEQSTHRARLTSLKNSRFSIELNATR